MTAKMGLLSVSVALLCGCGGAASSGGDADAAMNTTPGTDGSQAPPPPSDASVGDSATPPGTDAGSVGGGDMAVVTGAPAAPTNFIETAATQNSISLAWSVSTSSDVSFYNVYRGGKLLAKSTTTTKGADGKMIGTYTDSTATNAVAPKFDLPPPTYVYAVTAVDSQMRESAQQTNLHYWMYNTNLSININPTPGNTNPGDQGNMNFANAPGVAGPSGLPSIPGNFIQGNYTCATAADQIYNDKSGDPQAGDAADYQFSGCGYNQPYSGPPTVPEWALDLGAYNYMTLDWKPTKAGSTLLFGVISRLPQGDVFNQSGVELSMGAYGPKPVVGTWGTYKIPLKDLQIGKGTFVGSISGNILTVTSVGSGVTIQNGGWVMAGGLSAPVHVDCDGGGENGNCSATKLTGNGQAGTYEINPPPAKPIASTTFNFQRTNMYKLGIQGGTDVYYLNNIGWSVE